MNSTNPDPRLTRERLDQLQSRVSAAKIDYCEVCELGSSVFVHARNAHSREKLHKINSITKSVLSLLIGIAIDRGEIPEVGTPITEFYPQLRTTSKANVTIENLLTMTPGWDWQEMGDWGGRPFPMINSPDWVSFIFDRPMIRPTGKTMIYDSGCSHLLSAILQQRTGMTTAEYAERHLFKPLGIERYRWYEDAKGIVIGGFGLELQAPDLMKLGLLLLNRGEWNGTRVVSAKWLERCSQPRFHTYDHIGSYGYHWWMLAKEEDQEPMSPSVTFAMGYGGQYIFVVPERELVAVFASSLYKKTFHPLQLFKEWVL